MPSLGSRADVVSWLLVALIVGVAVAGTVATVMSLSARPQSTPASVRPANPTLARDLGLLDQPRRGATVVANLPTGTRLRLLGRLQDGAWLFVSPAEQIAISGWLPIEAVRDSGELGNLATLDAATGVAAPPIANASTIPARGAVGPDLVLQSVGGQQNRLTVVVGNLGQGDLTGAITVTVNNGPPRRIDVGKPLRSGESLQAVLSTEYVQRRARVSVTVSTPGDTNPDNNQQDVVVSPDVPLDLEVQSAASSQRDGHLVVTLRAHSPIPLVGIVSIAVRESPPSNRLLASLNAALDIAADGTQQLDIPDAIRLDLTKITVSIATDAIADANSANDSYPR